MQPKVKLIAALAAVVIVVVVAAVLLLGGGGGSCCNQAEAMAQLNDLRTAVQKLATTDPAKARQLDQDMSHEMMGIAHDDYSGACKVIAKYADEVS